MKIPSFMLKNIHNKYAYKLYVCIFFPNFRAVIVILK